MLHIVNTSPFMDNKLYQCISAMREKDGIILIGDGVYGLNHYADIKPKLTPHCPLYVLKDDALARGLNTDNDHINWLDYTGFVELTLRYNNLMSW